MINTDQDPLGEKKFLFRLIGSSLSSREAKAETQGRNREAGTETDRSGMLLTALLTLACPVTFLIQPRPSCLEKVPLTVVWALLHQLAVKIVSRSCTHTGVMEAMLQLRLLLLRCV